MTPLAPPGMPSWSGWNWYVRDGGGYRPTISVIDRPAESYDAYHERRKREEGARRVPFGFARALLEEGDKAA